MRSRHGLALLTGACLLVAGCAADVASGPRGALQERLDRGVTVEVTLEADPGGVDDPAQAARLREVLDAQAVDGPLVIASRSGDGVARGVVIHGGDLEVRLVDDTAYLRADAATLDEFLDGDVVAPDESTEADGLATPDVRGLLDALDGGWVGVSGLTEERLAEIMDDADVESDDARDDSQVEAVEDLLAERDLDDLDGLFTTYATVTGEGPWQVEVHARDLARALESVAAEADELVGASDLPASREDHSPRTDHDLDDLPERVGGVTVEAEDGVATRMVVDLATVAGALDHDPADDDAGDDRRERLDMLEAADARIVLTMVDVDDRLDTPTDASVVDVAILDALVGGDGPGDALGDLFPPDDSDPEG